MPPWLRLRPEARGPTSRSPEDPNQNAEIACGLNGGPIGRLQVRWSNSCAISTVAWQQTLSPTSPKYCRFEPVRCHRRRHAGQSAQDVLLRVFGRVRNRRTPSEIMLKSNLQGLKYAASLRQGEAPFCLYSAIYSFLNSLRSNSRWSERVGVSACAKLMVACRVKSCATFDLLPCRFVRCRVQTPRSREIKVNLSCRRWRDEFAFGKHRRSIEKDASILVVKVSYKCRLWTQCLFTSVQRRLILTSQISAYYKDLTCMNIYIVLKFCSTQRSLGGLLQYFVQLYENLTCKLFNW